MGCILNPIAKKAINKVVSNVSNQLRDAERKLNQELLELNNKFDHEVDQAVYKVEQEVAEKTREILNPLKKQVGDVVGVVKDPVDGVVNQFKDKVNFASHDVKEVVDKPINTLNEAIGKKQEELKEEVLTLVSRVAKEKNFAAECAADGQVGPKIKYDIRQSVAEVVNPKMAPFLSVVDGLINDAKDAIRTVLAPPRAPVEAVETEVRAAFAVVEKPLDDIYNLAYEQLRQAVGEVGDLVKEPIRTAGHAAHTVANTGLDTARTTFDTAEDTAHEGGKKAVEQAKIPAIISMGKEALSYAVQESKWRGHQNISDTRNTLNWSIRRVEFENEWAVNRVKEVPKRTLRETFATITKPIDDSKDTVLGPINAVYHALDEIRDRAFETMNTYRNKAAGLSDELVNDGCEAVIQGLVKSGYKRSDV